MGTSELPHDSASATGRKQMIQRHPLFFFFLFTFIFSWIFLIVEVLAVWGFLPNDPRFIAVVNVFFTFGPTFGAIITTGIIDGRAGLLQLRSRLKQWHAGWQWYLFIVVGIPAVMLLALIIQPGILASFKGLTPIVFAQYPLYFVVVWFGGGPLGEEIGWRGFALPRMQPRYGSLWGTLLLGIPWAFWHLPQFLTPYQGGGPGTGLATFVTDFSLFFVFVMALAIIMTWLFNHTKESIFFAVTTHACVDTPIVVLFPLFLAAGFTSQTLAFAFGLGVVALLIVILTRGKLGYQSIKKEP
jgi:membrane protease YdiL (CAAX protease family)